MKKKIFSVLLTAVITVTSVSGALAAKKENSGGSSDGNLCATWGGFDNADQIGVAHAIGGKLEYSGAGEQLSLIHI